LAEFHWGHCDFGHCVILLKVRRHELRARGRMEKVTTSDKANGEIVWQWPYTTMRQRCTTFSELF
jgi:hypothetical protein